MPGLSPLARGTRMNIMHGYGQSRFIPAGAGNTSRTPPHNLPSAVYPRWRGEHNLGLSEVIRLTGLSPLARGTLTLDVPVPPVARFIPAGAGNTESWFRL